MRRRGALATLVAAVALPLCVPAAALADATVGSTPTVRATPAPTTTLTPKPPESPKPSESPESPEPTSTPTTGAPAPTATGTPAPPADDAADRDAARQELGESSLEMLEAVVALRRAERDLPQARLTLAAARAQLDAAKIAAERAAAAAQQAQARLVAAQQASELADATLAEERANIGRLARAVYQRGSLSTVATILDARSPNDLVDRYNGVRSALRSERSQLAELEQASEQARAALAGMETVRRDLARTSADAAQQVDALAEREAQARTAEEAVERLVTARADALEAAKAALTEDELRAAEREAVSRNLMGTLQQRADALGAGGGSLTVIPGLLQPPVAGPVTSAYGMRVHPVTGVYKLHSGTDFGVGCGTPVGAAAAGTVLQTGTNPAYGKRVVVEHGVIDGALVATTYNHLEHIAVRPGQQLLPGEVLGRVGSTGYSTGCHLHLELLVGGEFTDPLPWLAP
jgi:murein DD-endopeptidase MepM/ murein hydrolase activator NlpD